MPIDEDAPGTSGRSAAAGVRVLLHDFADADFGRMRARAAALEEAGWDGLFLADSQNLTPDVFVALTVAAGATERLELGTAVANPITRHPAVVASAVAALQSVSGGRAVLGLGRGDSALLQVGLPLPGHAEFERLARQVRAYLHGEAVDANGYPSRIAWLAGAGQPVVPIQMFPSGPLLTASAATIADRVTVAVGARPERVDDRLGLIRTARAAAGLDERGIDVGAYVIVGVDDDLQRARDLVRGNVTIFAHFQRDDRGLDRGDSAVVRAVTDRWQEAAHGLAQSAQGSALTDDFIDHFAVVGDHATCVERLRTLIALGLDHLVVIGPSRDAPADVASAQTTAILAAVREASGS